MIIKAKHHWFIYPFMQFYTLVKIRNNFNKVESSGEFIEKGLPVLLILNHVSWWDGFWAMYLNIKLFKRKFHFMMLEHQLKKYWFFQKSGGFSVKKKSRSILESLNYSAEILSDSRNFLLLFPQGQISSMHASSFQFEKGIERILKKVTGKVQVIFATCLTDYFSEAKPGLYIYLKEYEEKEYDVEKLQQAYNQFYAGCIAENIRKKDL